MDEAHGVDAVERQHHLGGVKASPLLRHIVIAHQIDQVSSRHVLHHHVEITVVLEGVEQLQSRKGGWGGGADKQSEHASS